MSSRNISQLLSNQRTDFIIVIFLLAKLITELTQRILLNLNIMKNSKQTRFGDNNNRVHEYFDNSILIQQNLMDISADLTGQQAFSHSNHPQHLKSAYQGNQRTVSKQTKQNALSEIKKGGGANRARKSRYNLELLQEDLAIFDQQTKNDRIVEQEGDNKSQNSNVSRKNNHKKANQELIEDEKEDKSNDFHSQIRTPDHKKNNANLLSEQNKKYQNSFSNNQRQKRVTQQRYTNLKNRVELNKIKDDRTLFQQSEQDMVSLHQQAETQSQRVSQIPKRFRDSIGNVKAAIRMNNQYQKQSNNGSQNLSRKSKNHKQGHRFSLVSQEEQGTNDIRKHQKQKSIEPKLPPGEVFIDPSWTYRQIKQALVKYFNKDNIIKRIQQTKLQIYSCQQQIDSHRKYRQQIEKDIEKISIVVKDFMSSNDEKKQKIVSLKAMLSPENYYKKTVHLREFQMQNNVQIHKLTRKISYNSVQFYAQFTMHRNMLVKLKKDKDKSIADIKIKMSYLNQQTQDQVFFRGQNITDILKVNFKRNLQALHSPVEMILEFSQIYADLKRFVTEMDHISTCFSLQDFEIDSMFDKLTFKFTLLPNLSFLYDIDMTKLYIADTQFIKIYNPRDNEHIHFQLIETKSPNPIFNTFYNLIDRYM